MTGVALRPWEEVVRAYEAAGRSDAEPDVRRLRETADEFSAILYRMLFRQMRATVEKTGLLDGGHAEEVFRDFLDAEYASEAAKRQGGDVSIHVFEQALEAYEAASRSGRPTAVPSLPPATV